MDRPSQRQVGPFCGNLHPYGRSVPVPFSLSDTFSTRMGPEELAQKVVARMFDHDPFSQWLGIERVHVGVGTCVLRMTVLKGMLNGFAIAHGGISYSLADSCLAFAANSHGIRTVSLETSISHVARVVEGDQLTATAQEMSLKDRVAIYNVTVVDQNDTTVALFKGTVFRTGKPWFGDE